MSTRYSFSHNEAGSKDYKAAAGAARTAFRRFPHQAQYAEVHVNGHRAARRKLKDARRKTIHYLKTMRPGAEIVVEVFDSRDAKTRIDVARFYKTEPEPRVVDGPGTPGIDRFTAYVKLAYPTARWAGTCVCKSTTSGTHSDHADCAAVDFFDTESHILAMIHDFCTNPEFKPKYALWKYSIFKPSAGGGVYSGPSGAAYHAHGHFSATDGVYNSACTGDREVHG